MKKSSVRALTLTTLLALRALPVSAQPAPPPSAPAPTPDSPSAPPPDSGPGPTPAASAPPPEPVPPPAPPPTELPPEASAPAPETPKPKPPPYSLPWQLRGVVPVNAVRLDTSFGFYEGPTTRGGLAVVPMLSASYKVLPDLAPLVRVGLVDNSPPNDKSARTNILNPVLGVLYGPKIHPNLKLGLFLGMTLPIGSGGGTDPHPQAAPANAAGAATRSMMDNAMFAVNYLTVFPGVGFAFVGKGFTAQVEATIFRLWQTRGPAKADNANTNFTTGVHAGYFISPALSIGTELRHQRWLSTPTNIATDKTDSLRDTTTFAIGPRTHIKLGDSMWLRPGVSLSLPLDNPLAKGKGISHYQMLQIDIPFVF